MAAISVFIINYNGAAFIEACLDSVLASHCNVALEVIVVDNQSTDHSLEILARYKDRITVIKNHHNSGFSKGNNIAAQFAKGQYYFLLNNDTILQHNTIQLLYDYMIKYNDIGALVPKLLNKNGSIQCPGSIFGQWRFYSSKPIDVSFVAGAAVLMSKEVYDRISGLDENLFFYNDDVDLCKVLKKESLRLVYYPLAALTHFGGLSTKFRKLSSLTEGYRGGFYVCYKHYPSWVYHLYRIVVLLDIFPRLFIHFLRSMFSREQWGYVRLYCDVLAINWNNSIFVRHPEVSVDVL